MGVMRRGVEPRVVVRFAWTVVAFREAIWAGLCGFLFFAPNGPSSGGITSVAGVVFLIMVLIGLLTAVNLLFLDYVELSGSEVHQLGRFGLVNKRLPIDQLREIGVDRRRQGVYVPFTYTYVCIRAADEAIELNLDHRWEGEVGKAVRYLVDRGVPADDWVSTKFLFKEPK